jgi:hypothetical protein
MGTLEDAREFDSRDREACPRGHQAPCASYPGAHLHGTLAAQDVTLARHRLILDRPLVAREARVLVRVSLFRETGAIRNRPFFGRAEDASSCSI